jgi:hypothetical protein
MNNQLICPNAPKKRSFQVYANQKWTFTTVEPQKMECPPAPIVGYTQYYDRENLRWVYIKK